MKPLVLCTLVLLSAPAVAQVSGPLRPAQAHEVGMSQSVLDGAVGLFRESIERGDLVGAVLLVAKDGRIVLHEALGWRDKANDLPMERNTLFRMASNTKPVLAAAVAQLVEQERLAYDDLVREYVPEWDNYRSGFITISHLLSHSSGLRIPTLFLYPLLPNSTLQREVARYGAIGAVEPPGRTYSYNNPGYNTLAALVEIASGNLLEEQLQSALYTPLGMVDSYNHRAGHDLDGKLDRMGAVYYRYGRDGEWIAGGTPGGPREFPFARGSGGMISTAHDYAIFAQMILNGGTYNGTRILSEESVAEMLTPKIRASGEGAHARYYGYGWSLTDGVASHNGSDGTYAWVDHERGIIGLVFTQTPSGPNPRDRFRQMVNLSIEPTR